MSLRRACSKEKHSSDTLHVDTSRDLGHAQAVMMLSLSRQLWSHQEAKASSPVDRPITGLGAMIQSLSERPDFLQPRRLEAFRLRLCRANLIRGCLTNPSFLRLQYQPTCCMLWMSKVRGYTTALYQQSSLKQIQHPLSGIQESPTSLSDQTAQVLTNRQSGHRPDSCTLDLLASHLPCQ